MTPKEQQLLEFAHAMNNPWIALGSSILVVWILAWKGLALWKAAKNSSKIWFIVLLAVNTLGILEIIYFFFLDKNKRENAQQ